MKTQKLNPNSHILNEGLPEHSRVWWGATPARDAGPYGKSEHTNLKYY